MKGKAMGTEQQPAFAEQFAREPAVKDFITAQGITDVRGLALAAHAAHTRDQVSAGQLKALTRGQNMVAVPDEKATDADWAKVNAALGTPKSAADYNFKFRDNMQVESHFADFAKTLFHKLGVPQSRAQIGMEMWQDYVQDRFSKESAAHEADQAKRVADLQRSWGKTWDADTAAGQQALSVLGLNANELAELEAAIKLPAGLKALAAIGRLVTGGSTVPGSSDKTTITIDTPEQAKAEIQRLSADKPFQDSLRDKKSPLRQANLQRWEDAYAKAYPTQR